MSNTKSENDVALLMLAVGHCIMQWAGVELQLALLFHSLSGSGREASYLLWSRIRSFEAKMQIMNELASIRVSNAEQRRNWNLISAHTLALYKKRNRVAHSTPVNGKNGEPALEPFLVPFSPGFTITHNDVSTYVDEFRDASSVIFYFNLTALASQQTESQAQEPDLLRRLRSEDDRKREEQRLRALAWRQYLQRDPRMDG